MKKWLTVGAVLVCALIGGVAFYSRYHSDRTAPEIFFEGTLKYTDGMTEEELLSDVSAVDEHDGDVSGSLIVESVTVNQAEQTAVVRYAARDSHNNVAKKSRTLTAGDGNDSASDADDQKDGKENVMRNTVPSENDSFQGRSSGTESKETESETTKMGDIGREETETGDTEVESSGDDMTESESEMSLEPETEIEVTAPGAPHIKLTENHAQIKVGDSFDPLLYVATVEDDYDNIYTLWRDIQISGDYDVNTPGVYDFSFYVTDSSGNVSNHAKFRLTVKADK